MDPLTLAGSFATIVGLLGTYRAERRATESASLNDFLEWLKDRGFEELTSEIEKNTRASDSIGAMISENSEVLLGRLDRVDRTLSAIASHFEGVGSLALALRAVDVLSQPAISLLIEMESGQVDVFWISYASDRPPLLEARAGRFEHRDPRFLEDDLATMVELGLLRPDQNPKGDRLYRFTRAASTFVREMQIPGSNQPAPPDG